MPRWGTRNFKTKKDNIKKKRKVFFILFILMLLTLQTFFYVDHNLRPILISIAEARMKQIATNALNDAISKKIAQNNNFKDLIIFEKDTEGNIKAATFNYSEFARIVGEATARVELTLNELSKLEEKIPLGAAFYSDLLADMGPNIPLSMVPMGSAQVTPRINYHNAGINTIIMTVTIDILAEVQVVIPFVTEPTIIQTSVPIAQTQIMGDVPQFYYEGSGGYYGQSPNYQGSPMPIMPAVPINPEASQSQNFPNSIPSNSLNIEPIPGLESFYPVIPRQTIPSSF